MESPSDAVRAEPRNGYPRPTAIDFFAGAGGLTLGFEQAGFDVLAAVEYDPVHCATHAVNFPDTEVLCADVSRLSADRVRQAAGLGWQRHGRTGASPGSVDVIFGGPPCQGFSTIGKRLIDDERNQLVFHFFRLVTELRPRYFVMENVPGMAAGGHQTILSRLIAEFSECGYVVTEPVEVLQAAQYGIPQSRRRLFVLGAEQGEAPLHYPKPVVRPAVGSSDRTRNGQWEFDLLPEGPTVWDAIGDLPDVDRFDALLDSDTAELSSDEIRRMAEVASLYVRRLRGLEIDAGDLARPRLWNPSILTSSMRTVHTPLSVSRFEATRPGETEPISRFLRLDAGGLCNTLRAGTGSERGAFTSPRPIHPVLPRVITVREAARLHSFPDWFRLHATKWHGFRQVGNAVPPLLGRAVAERVTAALGIQPVRCEQPRRLGDPRLLEFTMNEAAAYFGAVASQMPKQRRRAESAGGRK